MAAYETKLPLADYAIFLAKFLFGAFLVRSSACTINDIFDRKMDAGVGQYPVSLPSHSYETHVFALRHEQNALAAGHLRLGAYRSLLHGYSSSRSS